MFNDVSRHSVQVAFFNIENNRYIRDTIFSVQKLVQPFFKYTFY